MMSEYKRVGVEELGANEAFHWVKPTVEGTPPTPRNEHMCVAVDSMVFVFGGFDESGSKNDLHIYDTSTCKWVKGETSGNGPSNRYGNSFVLVDRKIMVFGGMVGGNTFVFDVSDSVWGRWFNANSKGNVEMIEEPENDLFFLDVDTLAWEEVLVKGSIPSKRCGHAAWAMHDDQGHRAVVFGGWGEKAQRLNDMHQFDLEKYEWSAVNTTGRKPSPRCGFTASRVGNNVYVFGGWGQDGRALGDFYVLNLPKMLWTPLKAKGQVPPGRTGHTAVVVADKVYVFGGDAADMFYNELHILDTKKMEWQMPESSGMRPQGLSRHCACLVGSDMYIVGGWDRNFFYNDVYYLRTELASNKMRQSWAFKAVVVGDSGVGKTSIYRRLADDEFSLQMPSTIGVDYRVVPLDVDGHSVNLQLWDTAGQERFSTITSNYYRNAHGIVFVFDLTSQQSFDHLFKWAKEVDKVVGLSNVVGLVVGNKSDLVMQRKVDTTSGKRFALDNNMMYIETSAKDAINIERAFHMLCDEVISNASQRNELLMESHAAPSSISLAGLKRSSQTTLGMLQDRMDAFSTNRGQRSSGGCCAPKPASIADDF